MSAFARHCMHAAARKTIALVFAQFRIHGAPDLPFNQGNLGAFNPDFTN